MMTKGSHVFLVVFTVMEPSTCAMTRPSQENHCLQRRGALHSRVLVCSVWSSTSASAIHSSSNEPLQESTDSKIHYLQKLTRLSSHPMPASFRALVTTGHTSLRYLSAVTVFLQCKVTQRGVLPCLVCNIARHPYRPQRSLTSVLGEENRKGALFKESCGVVLF